MSDRIIESKQSENLIKEIEKVSNLIEIPASNVRSGLAEVEMQASQIIERLENIKITQDSTILPVATGFLQSEKKLPSEILSTLEALIIHSENSSDESDFPLPALDEISHLALITHSIVAYISHLDRQQLAQVTSRIITDTNRWLSHIFRFIDCSASYHNDPTECILRAVRLAIVARCPGYLDGGIQTLAYPCLYVSENSSALGLQYACRQLGLPLEVIRLVPCNTMFGTLGTMDISALQKMITTDLASNRTPLFVIADIGAPICGHVDNISRLHEVCKASNVWLHCRGHGLAALALAQGAGDLKLIADSMVLNLGSWLGIPSLPVVLLHRQIQNITLSVFESDPIMSRRLSSLSLWATLQALGRENISEKIALSFETCRIMYEIISKHNGIKLLSKHPGGETGGTIVDVINKPLNISILFDTAVGMVVFQFDGSIAQDEENPTTEKSIDKVTNASYFDRLNSWLGQILQRDCPSIALEIVEHKLYGTCIRYCPLELSMGEQIPNIENLENFAACFDQQTDILQATIRHKATFNRLVEESEVLRLINLPDWAGLGGVRFAPEGWETLLTDQAKTELNKLNTDLVEALKSTDNAFSLGEGADGLICVRFGMVTNDTDVEELLDLVISVGKGVQENSKVLDSMTEIVKKGIEAATADLQRESDEKLWNDGIVRHIPVVGSFVNWWSPQQKENGIKGRSLNLTQGVVESTENIYKYHMQMGSSSQMQGKKSPPPPMVQTSVSGHSRNVSQSSGTSNQDAS